MEDLESKSLNYVTVGEFLSDLKKEFGRENNKMIKVAELKKVEQGSRTIEKFVQEFKQEVKESKYKRRLLIEYFKNGMDKMIRRKLIEAERSPKSIKKWYEYTTNLDRHQRESK